MDWRRLDLNGLKVLHALMVDGAVVRAAERLYLTPSAVSHRLRVLRKDFGDPLFLRTRNGMEPTPRMREIGAAVATVVASLENATATAFLPAETRTTFHVVATESIISTLAPGLTATLREKAPGSILHLSLFERRDYSTDLLNGVVDLVLSVGGHTPPSVDVGVAPLLTDELDVLIGPSSPAWEWTDLDAEAYLALPHAYSLPWPPEENHLDQVLARRHLRRDIRLVVPHHAAAADAVALSDLALTLPSRVARQFVGCRPNLKAFPCPFPGAGHVAQEWATDRARSGRIAFLRSVLARVVDGVQEQSPTGAV